MCSDCEIYGLKEHGLTRSDCSLFKDRGIMLSEIRCTSFHTLVTRRSPIIIGHYNYIHVIYINIILF